MLTPPELFPLHEASGIAAITAAAAREIYLDIFMIPPVSGLNDVLFTGFGVEYHSAVLYP